ncbi:hypothetical protein F2P56_013419 [Juglans regia]|uniref:F-box protein At5g07610-like n=2 Tax=Juglans regia TaxID=51240 RepID=A0A2I4HQP2_JUGRE|nr:F-box protein At5g07610-like [Juglans regia]XP_035547228.1 F-box protein At5g07610-like [Juglans regia]XP_035547229.1 F-box protein At5g07610-like [Juglans regia]KAF5469337.1 hypothetical protein F2P56_013419 [Juglans regia]
MATIRKSQRTGGSSTTRLQMSAVAVASNEDLLREILTRLPVRPLVRLKVVCKQWCFLISDPEFFISHARRNSRSNGLLLKCLKQAPGLSLVPLEEYQPPRVLPFNFLNKRGTNVLDSCKGLLCYSMADLHDPMLISYYVCNLSSGDSTRIGVFDALSTTRGRVVFVSFDPLKSVHYKVIFIHQISSSSSDFLLKIDIYSSVTQSWKPAKDVIVPYDAGFKNEAVYMNGAIYWYDQTRKAVWYLDLDAECLDKVPDSMDWQKISSVKYFGESSGNLHLIATCRLQTTLLTIYEMKQDRSGWFVKYHCDLSVLADAFPRIFCAHYDNLHVYHLLCLLEGETKEEATLVMAVPGELISYNLKTNASKTLCQFGMFGVIYNRNGAYELETLGIKTYQYLETLARI